jgi:putative flippase GtrA
MRAHSAPRIARGGCVKRLWTRFHAFILRSALKFGVVGLGGYIIDVGIFNLLRAGALGTDDWFHTPLGAKVVSVTVSTLASWFGNRYWTFRNDRRRNFMMELFEFALIAVAGLGISLLCLWISHYVLGFDSLLADNISANVIGLGLATIFRFALYRFWVYSPRRAGRVVLTATTSEPDDIPVLTLEDVADDALLPGEVDAGTIVSRPSDVRVPRGQDPIKRSA